MSRNCTHSRWLSIHANHNAFSRARFINFAVTRIFYVHLINNLSIVNMRKLLFGNWVTPILSYSIPNRTTGPQTTEAQKHNTHPKPNANSIPVSKVSFVVLFLFSLKGFVRLDATVLWLWPVVRSICFCLLNFVQFSGMLSLYILYTLWLIGGRVTIRERESFRIWTIDVCTYIYTYIYIFISSSSGI